MTSAETTEPGGDSAWTRTVMRTASPVRMTGAGARGVSLPARAARGSAVKPGRQVATRANRCGSTASVVSPAVPLAKLVYRSTAAAMRPLGSARATTAPRSFPAGTVTVSTVGAPAWVVATRRSLSRPTDQAVTANVASAKAVASTIVVRTPPGRRAT